MVPADVGWSDLGSWSEVWARGDQDGQGNACKGHALPVDTTGSLIYGLDNLTVATVGVQNLIVVATRDAFLVASRDRAQDVRKVVDALKEREDPTGEVPSVVHRAWGTYQITNYGAGVQTRRIVVKPGAKLSSQLHSHRSEHWIVVSGTAEITIAGETFQLHENQSTFVSAGTVHRLANPGKLPLHLIEVQCGTSVREDDIVRLDDECGGHGSTPA
jgi:mannose-1-phosphate guanylyltransferase/mannose-6-phosphate isomerase